MAAFDRHTLRQMAAEFVVVVAGILVALAVDDWRNARQEERVSDEHLSDIAAEIRENLGTIERVQSGLEAKFRSLEIVLRFLREDASSESAEAILHAFAVSIHEARPWLDDTQFRSFQNSGELRLLRDRQLKADLADLYAAPDALFPQVTRFRSNYPAAVAELLPAQLQTALNPMRWYTPEGIEAPTIADDDDLGRALDDLHAHRDELLPLARNEAAVATGNWYVLSRLKMQCEAALEQLTPWDAPSSERPAAAD